MLIDCLGLQSAKVVSICGAGGKTSLMFALSREFVAAGERVLVTTTTKIARDEAQCVPSFAAASAREVLGGARALWRKDSPQSPGAVIAYSRVADDGERLAGFAPELVDELSLSRGFDRILVEADGSRRKPLKAPAAHEPVVPRTTDTLVIVAGLNGLGLPLTEDNVFRADIWAHISGTALGATITAESLARVVVHQDGLGRNCPADARRVLFLNRAESPRDHLAAKEVIQYLVAQEAPGLERVACGSLLPQPLAEIMWCDIRKVSARR